MVWTNDTHSTLLLDNRKEFLAYLRKNKLTIKDYLIKEIHKKDLLTGEDLIFKNEDQYLNVDFNSRENLNNYLISIDKATAKQYCFDFLKKRKERKSLVFAPSQIELKSHIAPSINIIQKGIGLDYNELVKEVELMPRFRYKSSFKTTYEGEMKIIQDTREKKPLKFKNIEIHKLDIGDYTVKEPYYANIFVERKSLADLIGTLCPKNFNRFKNELARAVEMDCYLIVIIEESFSQLLRMKDLKYIRSQASPDYILHKIREIMESSNMIQFLFLSNRGESERIIPKIFRLKKQVRDLDLQYVYEIGKL